MAALKKTISSEQYREQDAVTWPVEVD